MTREGKPGYHDEKKGTQPDQPVHGRDGGAAVFGFSGARQSVPSRVSSNSRPGGVEGRAPTMSTYSAFSYAVGGAKAP